MVLALPLQILADLFVQPYFTWGRGGCDAMLLSAYRVVSPSFLKIVYFIITFSEILLFQWPHPQVIVIFICLLCLNLPFTKLHILPVSENVKTKVLKWTDQPVPFELAHYHCFSFNWCNGIWSKRQYCTVSELSVHTHTHTHTHSHRAEPDEKDKSRLK